MSVICFAGLGIGSKLRIQQGYTSTSLWLCGEIMMNHKPWSTQRHRDTEET